MKNSLVFGGAFLVALTALTITADARMGAAGPGVSSGMSPARISSGDMRSTLPAWRTRAASALTAAPSAPTAGAFVRDVQPGRHRRRHQVQAKVKPRGVHRMNEHGEDPEPQAEPKPPKGTATPVATRPKPKPIGGHGFGHGYGHQPPQPGSWHCRYHPSC